MRRRSRPAHTPPKQFITSYHVNEVPLPYYNPLADPYLSNFFSNRKIASRIEQEGFVYRPKKQYPYDERRTKNSNRFLRSNSMYVPVSHIMPRQDRSNLTKSYRSSFYVNEGNMSSGILKRKSVSSSSASPKKIPFLRDNQENRPSSQTPSPTRDLSPEGRGAYFKSRRIFLNKISSPIMP